MRLAVIRLSFVPILAMFFANTAVSQTTPPPAPVVTPTVVLPTPPAPPPEEAEAEEMGGDGELAISEVPQLETEELTIERAKKSLEAMILVTEKYKESSLDDYLDLQEFVEKDVKGKELEADVKTFGFTSVNDWNLAVTSLSVAYNHTINDQSEDILQQIADIEKSVDMALDMKTVAIKTLRASIPSEGNIKIATDLIADKAYADKIKLLEATEE